MRRRTALTAAALGLPAMLRAQTHTPAVVYALEPDGAALTLTRFHPAGGPLDRHGARHGAWWQLLHLPLWPGWPVELQLRAQRRGHALQLTVMDAAPHEAPTVVVPLPLQADAATAARWSARFVLPERSTIDGVFVRIELWRADAAPPPAIVVRLRTSSPSAHAAPAPPQRPEARVQPPPGPLTQTLRERGAFELPVIGIRAVAPLPPWPEEISR